MIPCPPSRTTPPNAFISFNGLDVDLTNYRTHAVPYDSNPRWNYHATLHIPRTRTFLKTLKNERSAVTFSVFHTSISTDEKYELGKSVVDLGPLFSGCKCLHGWYPLVCSKEIQSQTQGQIHIKIEPGENLGSAIMEVSGPPIYDLNYEMEEEEQRPPTASKAVETKDAKTETSQYIEPTSLSIAFPKENEGDVPMSSMIAAAISAAKEAKPGHNVDTWVWTGHHWDHRKVEIQPLNEENGPLELKELESKDEMRAKSDLTTGINTFLI
jgi:hypothetical protein